MSDNVGGLAGEGEGLSEAQVMEGIEGLLDDKPKRPPRQQPQRTSDVPAEAEQAGSDDPLPGPDDPAPSDDEEEEDDDYTPEPNEAPEGEDLGPQSVEPPNGWSKQEKELFTQLPPEAQAVIARRESDRERVFVQKTQEIADHRKALESTFLEIQNERQNYARNLEQLLFVAAPEAQKFAQIDWQRLAQEQPADYVRLTAERDALRGRIGGIQQELQRVAAYTQQEQAQQFAVLRHAEQQRLMEAIPAFADPDQGPKKVQEMRSFLAKQGFSPEEIGQVVDHRVLVVVDQAMTAQRQRDARLQAEQKRTTPVSKVQPPGNGRQRSDTRASQLRQQKMNALRKSGSEKDAISYLLDVL